MFTCRRYSKTPKKILKLKFKKYLLETFVIIENYKLNNLLHYEISVAPRKMVHLRIRHCRIDC